MNSNLPPVSILYFDCFSGISGDMACGAMADISGELEVPEMVVSSLRLESVSARINRRESWGIAGKTLEVKYDRRKAKERNLPQIRDLIDRSDLPGEVKESALKAFTLIAGSEAKIHGVAPDEVTFHEVGAVDSILDITVFFRYLHLMEKMSCFCSPLPMGKGEVEISHGRYPLPAPAVLEILKGTEAVLLESPFDGEAVTPTGAALLVSSGTRFVSPPPYSVREVGYGVGTREIPGRPNICRVVRGEVAGSKERDEVLLVETNVDDMNPQHVELLMESAFDSGALDFYVTPVHMKKNRPGWLFSILTTEQFLHAVTGALFSLSTTTGIRVSKVKRYKLKRKEKRVKTSFGEIRVKVIEQPDGFTRAVPEYDDIKRLVSDRSASLWAVLQEVDEAWRRRE